MTFPKQFVFTFSEMNCQYEKKSYLWWICSTGLSFFQHFCLVTNFAPANAGLWNWDMHFR